MTDSGKSGETSPSDPSPPPLHPSASASSITTSPPVPPPDFNPPANISSESIESTIGAISPPPPEPFEPMMSPGVDPSAISSGFMSRPALQALQRNDSSISSNNSSASSGVFSSGSQSDGGEHLIEARNDLLSQSGHTSREDSEEEEEELTSTTPRYNFDVNVITATPPLQPGDVDQPGRYSGGESSREQTWDSVWPTPDALARANSYSLDTPSSSRYPRLTPVSPFVTPSFSPAVFPAGSSRPTLPPLSAPVRRSSSPSRRAQSPRRPSPHTSYSETFDPPDTFLHRRRSITSMDVPPLMSPSTSATSVSISKHGRSLSTSNDLSPNSRTSFSAIIKRPQPTSPPQSPRSTAPDRPGSPARRRKHTLPTPSSSRLTELGSSPYLRPRAQNSASRESPMMAPEEPVAGPSRISPRARTPTSPTQKLPDDDIPPLDSRSEGLPPAVASSPLFPPDSVGDDGLFSFPIETAPQSAPSLPFAPLARPANLRRALSDYQTRSPRTAPLGMSRSSSLTSDLDKSPKRPGSASSVEAMDRPSKSPKVSPRSALPEVQDELQTDPEEVPIIDQIGDVPLMDEGDVLPQDTDLYMDITFEDEGLNTLERIFLLSKSDFAFHRAYIARVLGDLLYDVDPCESVEYVLPLISSFTLDDDEGVREAFAQDLHRIVWYFYSVCRITPAGTEAQAPGVGGYDGYGTGYEQEYPEEQLDQQSLHSREDSNQTIRPDYDQTVTVTSEGMDIVDKPTPEEIRAAPRVPSPPHSILSGPTSGTSTMSKALTPFSESGTDDTPATSISDARRESADAEVFLPDESDKTEAGPIPEGPPFERPTLPVDFFTPLLGSLLLNVNTVISESVRTGLVYLIARLKGKGELTAERWGTILDDTEEPRAFIGQTGPHSHQFRPIPSDEKDMIERELIEGLVVGMGRLSIEMPDHLYDEGMTLEDSHAVLESYADQTFGSRSARSSLGSSSEVALEREAFQAQLIAEATAGRATSMNLIGALCDYYTGPEVVAWGFVEEVLKCRDGDVPVRAEGAVALSMLAKVAPVEHVYSFIPLFELLANDDLAQVRQSACLSLPSLCRRIESADYRRSFAIKAMHSLTTFNADVRCAALEVLGELIYVFADDSRGPPMELMQVYLDEEDVRRGFGEDWDTVASFNFPGVALTLGADHWHEIQPLYQRIHERAGEKPRRTLAASLHELAKILTPEQCAKDLMPVYRSCVTGVDEIRELVFEHIDVFLDRLPLNLAWETYLELAQAWKENNLGGWRAREQLALHIPAFFKTFHSLMDDQVLGMLKDALLDPFAAVRDAATKGIPEAYEILGDESDIARRFRDGLLSLGKSSRFRQRQTFVRCLREFVKPPPNRQAFEDFFLPFLGSLSRDVVDVRLGLAQTVADLFVVGAFYADKVHAPRAILDLARLLAKDEAVDVRNTIKHVKLDHLEENDTVPYEVKSPSIAKRAVVPKDLVPDHAPVQPAPLPDAISSEDSDTEGQSPTNDRSERSPDTSGSGTPRNPKSQSSPSSGQTSQAMLSPTTGAFHHRIRIDRRPSAEMTSHMEKMQLDTSLLTPTTPGTARNRNRARARETEEGHYISSPSPNEPAGGMDPFSISFARATPEGSPAAQTRGLESPVSSNE